MELSKEEQEEYSNRFYGQIPERTLLTENIEWAPRFAKKKLLKKLKLKIKENREMRG